MITQDKLKKHIHYDPLTGIFTRISSGKGGCAVGGPAGAVKKSGRTSYLVISVDGFRRSAQQFAWLYVYGKSHSGVIDHIDGDGLNNRIDNLRDVTHSENARNQRLRSSNSSGFMGVTWREDNKKWRVRINNGIKRITIGHYDSLSDAVFNRLKAEKELSYHDTHGVRR